MSCCSRLNGGARTAAVHLGRLQAPRSIASNRRLRRDPTGTRGLCGAHAAAAAVVFGARRTGVAHRRGGAVLDGRFLLPLLGHATRRARARLAWLAGIVTFGGICITVLLPTYSAAWPQRVNVEYWLDTDGGRAHWWAQAASLRLPRAMSEALKFDPVPRARFPGNPVQGFVAPAPALKLAPPELTQISAAPIGAALMHVELLLHSARAAPAAFVLFPAGANIQEVEIATSSGPLRAKLHKAPGRRNSLCRSGPERCRPALCGRYGRLTADGTGVRPKLRIAGRAAGGKNSAASTAADCDQLAGWRRHGGPEHRALGSCGWPLKCHALNLIWTCGRRAMQRGADCVFC